MRTSSSVTSNALPNHAASNSTASPAATTSNTHPEVDAVLNLQRVGRDAKPYQVRQFIRMVERYDLIPEELS